MHEEVESKMRELSEIKERLVSDVRSMVVSKGLPSQHVKECGEIVDMIKDLAEAEEKCWKACYYKTVIKAMEDTDDKWNDEGMGYNTHHSARTGRFTSGRGSRGMGFRPMDDEDRYVHEYLNNPSEFRHRMMGYNPSNRNDMNEGEERYGHAYRKYQDAKRGYTQTNSPEYRDQMRNHMHEHVADTMVTFRDMWSNADPEMKKQMKADLTKLVGDMNV